MRRRVRLAGITAAALALMAVAAPQARAADSVAGVPADQIGTHGPAANYGSGLELVAHSPIKPADEVRDGFGNNGAPALVGNCAYVGRWHDYRLARGTRQHGVHIVDIDAASATYTQVLGEIAGSAVDGATSREIRAVDLPGFKLLVLLTFSDNLTNRPNQTLNTLRLYDATDCRAPRLVGMYDLLAQRPHEFFLWADPDPAHNVNGHPRLLAFVSVPIEAPNLHVVDISNPSLPYLASFYDAGLPVASLEEPGGTYLGNYVHSVSVADDGSRAYLSYWDAGVFSVNTSLLALGLPAAPILPLGLASVPYDYSPPDIGNTHSAAQIPGKDVLVVGDEQYVGVGGCPYGWLRTVAIGSPSEAPSQSAEYRLAENKPENCNPATRSIAMRNSAGELIDGTFSMHNQTVLPRYTLATWYGGGLRVIDLADPASPVEAGFFVPAPLATVRESSLLYAGVPLTGGTGTQTDDWWVETWSYAIVRDGLIYVTDIRNGLYILKPAADAPFAAEIAATPFAEGNSNLRALGG